MAPAPPSFARNETSNQLSPSLRQGTSSLRLVDIVRDTKDWTWVLQRPCSDCGFDASSMPGRDVAAMLRTCAAHWQDELRRPDVRVRPAPSTWSPLEYACHVRDVCRRFEARLTLMLDHDDPVFENWDQDATALKARYAEQDPAAVAVELLDAASTLAAHFDDVDGRQWQRGGRRSDGAQFTVDSFARYFIHDVVHHLHDIDARSRPANPSE